MKNRMIALTAALLLLLALFAGCADTPAVDPAPKPTPIKKAQLVVAMNPILVDETGAATVAYNDVKNAIKSDREAQALTAMTQGTDWRWAYKSDGVTEDWKPRATYALDRWMNGAGVTAKKLSGYAFTGDGTLSLASYTTAGTALAAYTGDSVPAMGLLVSVTGDKEEALTYTAPKDGTLAMPTGTITAIEEVAGVKTGFLAEDGTPRSASIRILLNNKQIWSGTLCNSTAAADGVAVTQLTYPQLDKLRVKAGDMLFISVKLNAAANADEDVTVERPDDSENWAIIQKPVQVEKPADNTSEEKTNSDGSIPMLTDYASTFTILTNSQSPMEDRLIATSMADTMMAKLRAEIPTQNDYADEVPYEIYVSSIPLDSRPASLEIYEELTTRANNANDFIVRLVGQKVYIMAGSSGGLQKAVDHFIDTFCQNDRGAIPAGYNYAMRAELMDIALDGIPIGNYTIRTEKYPSYMLQAAAEQIQATLLEKSGYLLPIKTLKAGAPHVENEIRLGPMNADRIKVDRVYDQRFTNQNDNEFMSFPDDGYLDKPESYYIAEATRSGNSRILAVQGGSSYAVNAAVCILLEHLLAGKAIDNGFTLEGNYVSNEKAPTYALSGGYGLTFAEEFSYTGSDETIQEDVLKRWTLSTDTTAGPTQIGTDPATGNPIWDQQRRPAVYGDNWWIYHHPNSGTVNPNGYLLETTKKESYGYDACRLLGFDRWGFRYGIFEVRLLAATRNGACSAVWTASGRPVVSNPFIEIDLYENFGQDYLYPTLHTWGDHELPGNIDGHVDHVHMSKEMQSTRVYPEEGEHFYDTFHHLGFVWTPYQMIFFLDGQPFNTVDTRGRSWDAMRNPTSVKLTNGTGSENYTNGWDVEDFVEGGSRAHVVIANGETPMKSVEDFFEVYMVDYVRLMQLPKEGLPAIEQSMLKFDRRYKG